MDRYRNESQATSFVLLQQQKCHYSNVIVMAEVSYNDKPFRPRYYCRDKFTKEKTKM